MVKPEATTDTKELEALLSALNRSAERLQTLWFSFIGLTIYLLVTALTTTHMNLLLNEAQVLPIVNMKVPLLPFYVIAPIFYVVIHFYVLLMLTLLARSAKVFEDELGKVVSRPSRQETFRMRLENALFLQLLVGAVSERRGLNGRFLAAMALITIAIAPVITLLVIQMQFLPYHHLTITWLHRVFVCVDMVFIVFLWRGYRHRWGWPLPRGFAQLWRERGRWWFATGAMSVLLRTATLCLVVWLTLVEGRWYNEPPTGFAPIDRATHGFVVGENLTFSDRLVVHGETIVGADLFEKAERERKSRSVDAGHVRTRDFSGRDFSGADFEKADLRGVDFSSIKTKLIESSFSGAYLDQSNFSGAEADRAIFSSAQLRGSEFYGTSLHNANFNNSILQSTILIRADLRGSSMISAQMQGAKLQSATLWCANLKYARLQDANLSSAQLQLVNLPYASLEGADLIRADMKGAVLDNANLQIANLTEAQMQGSSLEEADLSGSKLDRASMHGANIEGVILSRSSLNRTYLLRNPTPSPITSGAFVQGIRYGMIEHVVVDDEELPLSPQTIDTWVKSTLKLCTDREAGDMPGDRFDLLLSDDRELDLKSSMYWSEAQSQTKRLYENETSYKTALAEEFIRIACDMDVRSRNGRPYVARSVLRRFGDLDNVGMNTVRDRMLSAKKDYSSCPGVEGFTEEDWKKLEIVRPR